MEDPRRAIALLRKYAPSEELFQKIFHHTRAVTDIALRYGRKIPGIDLNFLECAALLHDIGRLRTPLFPAPQFIRHGIVGAEILRKEGLEERYALVCERHIGVGIRKEDIVQQKLDLPLRDFVPLTKEEKIIAHSDNLVEGDREIPLQKVIDRFTAELGPVYGERVKALAAEVGGFCKTR